MIKYHYFQQGTEEWYQIRAGRFTASKARLLTSNLSNITPQKYIAQVMQEQISGRPTRGRGNFWQMEHGTENEPVAIKLYEKLTGNTVDKVGFISKGDDLGASTDGLVSFDGIIEVKCPATEFAYRCLQDPKKNKDHYLQMQFALWVSGRQWCDYVVFDPDFPEGKNIVIHHVERDEEAIEVIEEGVNAARELLNEQKKRLEKYFEKTQNIKNDR